jgi:hypothetical protein
MHSEETTGRFTATVRGAVDTNLRGKANHETLAGELLLGVLTNFSIRLTDDDRSADRAVYFVRRDTSLLTVGTYPLLNLTTDDAERLDPKRVWAYVGGVGDDFAYSREGELQIEEARHGRLVGTFRFRAAPLSASSSSEEGILVNGSFESSRR